VPVIMAHFVGRGMPMMMMMMMRIAISSGEF
jgi:hypothetical protein